MSESDPSWGGRQQRQQSLYPELAVGSVDDAFNVDSVRRLTGDALTSIGSAAESAWIKFGSLYSQSLEKRHEQAQQLQQSPSLFQNYLGRISEPVSQNPFLDILGTGANLQNLRNVNEPVVQDKGFLASELTRPSNYLSAGFRGLSAAQKLPAAARVAVDVGAAYGGDLLGDYVKEWTGSDTLGAIGQLGGNVAAGAVLKNMAGLANEQNIDALGRLAQKMGFGRPEMQTGQLSAEIVPGASNAVNKIKGLFQTEVNLRKGSIPEMEIASQRAEQATSRIEAFKKAISDPTVDPRDAARLSDEGMKVGLRSTFGALPDMAEDETKLLFREANARAMAMGVTHERINAIKALPDLLAGRNVIPSDLRHLGEMFPEWGDNLESLANNQGGSIFRSAAGGGSRGGRPTKLGKLPGAGGPKPNTPEVGIPGAARGPGIRPTPRGFGQLQRSIQENFKPPTPEAPYQLRDLGPMRSASGRGGMLPDTTGGLPSPTGGSTQRSQALARRFEATAKAAEQKFLKEQADLPTTMQKIGNQVVDVMNATRQWMTGPDVSYFGRQGEILATAHPLASARAAGKAFSVSLDENAARALEASYKADPAVQIGVQHGLDLPTFAADAVNREEQVLSRKLENLPGVGKVYEASNRNYTASALAQRAEVWKVGLETITSGGASYADPLIQSRLDRWAQWVNAASGRGNVKALEGFLNNYGRTLNAVFFAPRFMISRFQAPLMAAGAALDLAKSGVTRQAYDPVSKMIAKDMLAFVATGNLMLRTAKLAGASVEDDPNSSDWGKIRVGATSYDIWGGEQPTARFVYRLASGKTKSLSTGDTYDTPRVLGRNSVLTTYLEGKLAPVTGTAFRAAIDNNFDPQKEAEGLAPLVGQDIYGVAKSGNIFNAVAGTAASIVGIGVNTSDSAITREMLNKATPGGDYSSAPGTVQRQVQADNPDLAKRVSDEKMSRGGPSKGYEEVNIERTNALNAIPMDATGAQKRDAMNAANDAARAKREKTEQIFGKLPTQASSPDEKALNDWYDAFTKNPDGSVNQEATDQKRADLMSTWDDKQRAYVDEQTGTADPRLREDLRKIVQTSKDLEKAGFFALRNEQFQRYVAQNNNAPGYKGEPYYTYKDSVVKNWADQYTQQGYQPGIAQQMASDAFDKKYKEFGSWFANTVRLKWEQQHPQLAVDAVNAGYIKPSGKDEVGYINQLSDWLKTRK